MTAVLSHLDGWDIAAILFGAWLILGCVVAVPIGRAMARAEETQGVPYPDCVPVPPPAPRITQADVDETWLDAWPTHVERSDIDQLEQRVFDRLFEEQIACEGLS